MPIDLSKLEKSQKFLLGIVLSCLAVHFILKLDDVVETLDMAYKWFKMGNGILGLTCLSLSGWESWKAREKIQTVIKGVKDPADII